MKKTLATEIFLTLLFMIAGIAGMYFLNGNEKAWLLPIYTAIILLAYIVRWEFVLSAGFLMPLISYLLSFNGAFQVVPLIIFIAEIIATGLFIYFPYEKWNFGIQPSLVTGIFLGRLFGGIAAWLIKLIFSEGSFGNLYSYTVDSLVGDIKGIAVQLAFVPLIVLLLNKLFGIKKRR